MEDVVLLHKRQIFLENDGENERWNDSANLKMHSQNILVYLLNHERNILVQVATVKLHKIDKYMKEVWREAYVHPKKDKRC